MSDKNDLENQSERYLLTPKGFFVLKFGLENGTKIWDEFVAFAKEQNDYEELRGTPAVILEEGGYVISLEQLKAKDE